MENEKLYLIPDGLLKALINYLSSRPYNEVYKAMPGLSQLKELDAPASESEEA